MPRSASGTSATMISALKITADRMADCGVLQPHDVQRAEHRERRQEHRRDDGEVLGHVVGDRERGQRATRDQQLLANLDDLDQLRRVRIEIDHVARFFRRLRAGVHRHADVGLRQRRRVVGAVAGHRHQLAVGLLALDERHLVLGRRLREEVVHAGFGGDRRGGERIVAGDHHGLDAHRPQMREPLLMPPLTMSFRWMTPSAWRPSATTSGVPPARAMRSTMPAELLGDVPPLATPTARWRRPRPSGSRGHRPRRHRGHLLLPAAAREIHAGHARLRGERHERRLLRRQFTSAQAVLLLGQDDDRSAFRRLVRQRRELRGVGERSLR